MSETNRMGEICDALRRAILEQALKPGTKLPEDALGERFGVSRTIARHALGQLAAEGLVELQRNRGATVARPSWADSRDLFDIRTALEKIVMARLAGRLNAARLRRLEEHVQKEDAVRGQQDPIAIRLATEFHLLLAEMTDSPVLAGYVRELCLRCGLTLAMHGRPHSSDCAISEHREIIAALRSGDAEQTVAAMDQHLRLLASRALVETSQSGAPDLQAILAPYARSAGE